MARARFRRGPIAAGVLAILATLGGCSDRVPGPLLEDTTLDSLLLREDGCGTLADIQAHKDSLFADPRAAWPVAASYIRQRYGPESLRNTPFRYKRIGNGVMFVGTLPPHADGGVPQIGMCLGDGRVVYMYHDK